MKTGFKARRLDVARFAREAAQLSASAALADFPRLAAEAAAPATPSVVDWSAKGELRSAGGESAQCWLHLCARATVPLVCQRCLEVVETALDVDRWFRFARDEQTAASQDEEAEEDVLAIDLEFDLQQLVEDELLLALPLVPMHDQCPLDVRLAAVDPDFERAAQEEGKPLAALEQLRRSDKR